MEEKKELEWIWISTKRWTAAFDLAIDGKIIKTPPIGWKFRNFHYHNLLKWLKDIDQLLDWKIYFKGWQDG